MKKYKVFLIVLALVISLVFSLSVMAEPESTDEPTPTATVEPTETATPTPTATETATPTIEPSATASATATATSTAKATPTASAKTTPNSYTNVEPTFDPYISSSVTNAPPTPAFDISDVDLATPLAEQPTEDQNVEKKIDSRLWLVMLFVILIALLSLDIVAIRLRKKYVCEKKASFGRDVKDYYDFGAEQEAEDVVSQTTEQAESVDQGQQSFDFQLDDEDN